MRQDLRRDRPRVAGVLPAPGVEPSLADGPAATGPTDLVGFLDAAASVYHGRDFLVQDDGRWSYREVAEQTRRAAAWLRRAGVRPGDRVLVAATNQVEVILLALAAARAGAIFILLHEATKPATLRRILDQTGPIVCGFDAATAALADLAPGTTKVWLGGGPHFDGSVPVCDLLDASAPPGPPVRANPDDPAFLVYTSGSTGEPRGVVVSHDNVIFTTTAIQERLAYQPDDVVGLFLPLSFDYGLYQVFLAANAGAALYVGPPGAAGPPFLRVLRDRAVSVLPLVPGLVGSLLKLLARDPAPPPRLRAITSTGDHLPEHQVDELQRRLPAAQVYPMYGLTECKRVSILCPEEWPFKRGSVGRALDGTWVRVVGADALPLPPGQPGELVVSGRHVTRGYWGAPEETEARFRPHPDDGRRELRTGDRGLIDEDGYVRVIGRNDAIVKHLGFRVSPAEIELAAAAAPGVVEAGLATAPDGRLHLFLRAFDDQDGVIEATRDRLRQSLEWFKVPECIHLLDNLPRTSSGKIDRPALRAQLEGESR